jgi:glutaredoxin
MILILPVVKVHPVFASPGLTVNKQVLQATVAPGSTKIFTVTVSSADDDYAADIAVEVNGLGQTLEGTYLGLDEHEDSGSHTALGFITVSPEKFHLEPGSNQEVEVRIDILDDVHEGGYYAITYIRSMNGGNNPAQVDVSCSIGIPIVLTVENTELVKTGRITDFDVVETIQGNAVDIAAVFKNTGNYHYKALAKASLRDESGIELDSASTALTNCSIIPCYSREFRLSLVPDKELLPDGYYVILEIFDEDGNMIADERTRPLVRWLYLGGIILGCFLAGLLVLYFVRRRRDRYRNRSLIMIGTRWIIVLLSLMMALSIPTGCVQNEVQSAGTRMVVVEVFGTADCPHCPPAKEALEVIVDDYGVGKILLLEYVLTGHMACDDAQDRAREYEVRTIPAVFFNGQHRTEGEESDDKYVEAIESERLKNTTIALSATRFFDGDKVHMNARILNNGVDSLEGAQAVFVVYEDTGDRGSRYLVRDITISSLESLSAGDARELDVTSDMLFQCNMSNIEVVVFVQEDTGEILHATMAERVEAKLR